MMRFPFFELGLHPNLSWYCRHKAAAAAGLVAFSSVIIISTEPHSLHLYGWLQAADDTIHDMHVDLINNHFLLGWVDSFKIILLLGWKNIKVRLKCGHIVLPTYQNY
jgi:hypothetical protein